MPNTAQKIDVLRAIKAPATAALHWPDLVEAALPESQHVLRNFELRRDFADGAECVGCLVHAAMLPGAKPFQIESRLCSKFLLAA
jgi:hypothetical protein